MSNGFKVYRGPSMLDGAPIVVIATGTAKASSNGKTGDLIQTWILREDVSPKEATETGADASICGDCPHRGHIVDGKVTGRSCYVTIHHAPRKVWETYHRGVYPTLSSVEARELVAGRKVRLGAYGDPAAVPFEVWANLLADVVACTGYTHQWKTCDERFSEYVMASCDTPSDYLTAKMLGYRTFRVRLAGEAKLEKEVVCPASAEAGHKTTCAACVACGGFSSKAKADIVIVAHGSAAVVNAYARLRAA